MSLLDDVSIVVTPNGYKAGELYAVIPVPTEGSELVTDSDFLLTGTQAENTTGTYWTTGDSWSISGGNATLDGTQAGGSSLISNLFTVEAGRMYKVTVNVSSTSSGFRLYDTIGVVDYGLDVGENTFYRIPSSSTSSFNVTVLGLAGTTGEVSSVSVKEYTSADMDVTRNTAATRVDENGLVNYAEVLGGEEDIDGNFPLPNTKWPLSGFTISDNKLHCVSDGTYNNAIQNNVFVVGKTYKITFDITGWTLGDIRVRPSGQSPFQKAGANGSYTFYYTATNHQIAIERNTPCNMYLENLVVKEVTRDNVPRIDYTGGGCPHILAEPMRTNLLTYSEDFTNAIWTKVGSSVTPNATTSPDGTINADKLVEDTSTGGHQIQSITSASNSTIYTTSVFVKYAGREWIRFTDAQSSNRIHFNTLTGVFGTISGTVIDYNKTALENGWYKLSFTTTSVATAYTPRIALAEADNDISYTGDGVSGVYIYGAQLEVGSYATSYIPNFGTALGVTRIQDIFTRDGIGSLINSTEGVLFVEMAALSNDITARTIGLSDGTTNNRVVLRYADTSNRVQGFIQVGGATNGNIFNTSYTITNFLKVAYKWKAGDFALWINGTEVATSTDATSFSAGVLTEIQFNEGDGAGNEFFGKVKQLQVYKTALTDEQLLQLTGESGTDFYESYAEMAAALTYTIQ